ncbi:MAG TPA: hypothetical protein DDX98_03240 [Bacteroidales bacterium]|jgi:hypothetical protein|nr:hypothetical protein [Bacteroidales bacterium]
MVLLLIILFIVLMLFYLLVVPISMVINTKQSEYFVTLPGIIKSSLEFNSAQIVVIHIKLLFFGFKIKPFENKKARKKKEKQTHRKTTMKKPLNRIPGFLKAFSIKRFYADIDTGDFPTNAQLIPIVQTINGKHIQVGINFENRNDADIKITTRLYRLISAFFRRK